MTWTTPRTWIAGEIVTAALMNAQIRDNLLSIVYAPISVEDQTDLLAFANTTFGAGSPVCGTTFTAPDSGKILLTVTGHVECNTSTEAAYVSFEVRSGGTIGTGTITTAAITDNGVGAGAGGGTGRTSGSNRLLITGLTGGATSNVRTMHLTTGGTGDVFYRRLLIEAVH
jgi:hypothetical protein